MVRLPWIRWYVPLKQSPLILRRSHYKPARVRVVRQLGQDLFLTLSLLTLSLGVLCSSVTTRQKV